MRRFFVMHGLLLPLRLSKVVVGLIFTVFSMAAPSYSGVVSFGSGVNQFRMDFVTIGNPSNSADFTGLPNPAGSVGYTYDIGKFEVSRDMVNKYNATVGTMKITLGDMTNHGGNGINKPATGVSWNGAARFVNWLNTSTGGFAAYNFTTFGINDNITPWTASETLDYDASNPYRSRRATYVLPSYNEWYKAAFYDPNKTTGSDKYWNFATGSDAAPTPVAWGTTPGTAVISQPYTQGPANVTQAGGLSPYGVMGLGGNVWEWEETSSDLANSVGSSFRGIRGGVWVGDSGILSSSTRDSTIPNNDSFNIGFRVASLSSSSDPVVPEPSMMVIVALFGIGGLMKKRGGCPRVFSSTPIWTTTRTRRCSASATATRISRKA
jgi:hypothetical protein